MEQFWRDVRYAARSWRRAPGFTAIVVLTLAFGIGANSVAFSIVNTLFLNPFPVYRPSELVVVQTVDAGSRTRDALPVSYLNLKDLAVKNDVFDNLAGHTTPTILTLLNGDTPQRLFGELVTGNYFATLGLRPVRGRFFAAQEDTTPGAAPVLVLAYGAWQRRFGGTADILGRALTINGVPFSVIGIAPEGFKGVDGVFGPDVWIPAMMADTVLPSDARDRLRNRGALAFRGVARLKSGVTAQQAEANLATIARALEREYPDANRGRGVTVAPLTRAALLGSGGMSAVTLSLLLLAIPGLILLIACANVASLMLNRAAARRQEITVRLALGSDRSHLVRHLLTESMLLACAGGLSGFAVANIGIRALWSLRPPEVASNLIDPDIDVTVLLFTMAISLATGVVFGLVPACQSTRTDIVRALSEHARSVGGHRRRITLGKTLLVGQVTLSLVSLITAGVLLRSVQQLYLVDPGFETSRLGIAMISPGQAGYNRIRSEAFYRDLQSRVAGMPGVTQASWATQLPLFGRATRSVSIEGAEVRDRTGTVMTIVNAVEGHYFETTGIALTRGRSFSEDDRDGSLPVAIVNETLAARAWPNVDPLGRRLRLGADGVVRQVVGVAKTANYGTLAEAPQPCVYLPLRQEFSDSAVLYVRTTGDPTGALAAVQREVRAMDSRIDVADVRTIRKVISQALFGATTGVGLLSVFGLVALGLASLGLYGTMAHAVNQRQREIGLRMALGAQRSSVLGLVFRQGLAIVAIGMVIGAAASAAVGRALSGIVFGASAIDPVAVGTACLVLAITASAACYLPARKASRLDPMVALRET